MKNFEFLSRRDAEGYIAANERIIIVAFRGTEPTHLRDLLADAQFHKVQGPLGEVHRSFLGVFKLVKDDLFSTIQRLRDRATRSRSGVPATVLVGRQRLWRRLSCWWMGTR